MSLKDQVYAYDRRIEGALKRVKESDIDENSKKRIFEFYQECLAQGYSKARMIKYLDMLERIARFLGKPFVDINRNDVADFVRKIEGKNYSEWTKHDYKVILKIFYRWLRKTESYPEEVSWIKARTNNNTMLPEELLTEDEVKTLAEAANNLRDRALVLVLYESGCRVGEILSLRIKHVQFDENGAQLIVDGKTGMRRVRIIASAPNLAQWIENHPLRKDSDAPLWISLGTRDRNTALSYGAAKAMLKDLAIKAGIRKRIYPHLFRHSRATHLANHLTEAQMKQHFGWAQSSRMAATYVHLSGRDVDSALLKLQGIQIKEEENESKLKVAICSRCGEKNSPTSKFCMRCGLPLNLETALKLDEAREKADQLMEELIKNPKVLDALLEAIKQLGKADSQMDLLLSNEIIRDVKEKDKRSRLKKVQEEQD